MLRNGKSCTTLINVDKDTAILETTELNTCHFPILWSMIQLLTSLCLSEQVKIQDRHLFFFLSTTNRLETGFTPSAKK